MYTTPRGSEEDRSTVFSNGLKDLKRRWIPEVTSVSTKFTSILVQLEKNEIRISTESEKSEISKKFKTFGNKYNFSSNIVCDSKDHVNSKGKSGNVEILFWTSFENHFRRKLDYKSKNCFCDEIEQIKLKEKVPEAIHRPFNFSI